MADNNPMTQISRSVFITGGGSGLGEAVARHLAALGWQVAVAGRRAALLRRLADELGATVRACPLDVTDAVAVEQVIRDFRPDALVNSAAVLAQGSVFADLTPERFSEALAINVTGSFNVCRAAMRLWREAALQGDIVNVASLAGIRGLQKFPGFAAYAASKHAVVGLTEALALEGRPHGIRVNAIAPGTLRTPMTEALGLNPRTTPAQVVPTVEFLLDRARSAPLTGATLEIYCNDE
jgi:NAD(P)-dependent dehydrogenase (short-subunit alcohol dehydrogenase family)